MDLITNFWEIKSGSSLPSEPHARIHKYTCAKIARGRSSATQTGFVYHFNFDTFLFAFMDPYHTKLKVLLTDTVLEFCR